MRKIVFLALVLTSFAAPLALSAQEPEAADAEPKRASPLPDKLSFDVAPNGHTSPLRVTGDCIA